MGAMVAIWTCENRHILDHSQDLYMVISIYSVVRRALVFTYWNVDFSEHGNPFYGIFEGDILRCRYDDGTLSALASSKVYTYAIG